MREIPHWRLRLRMLLYGRNIFEAMELDLLLEELKTRGILRIATGRTPTDVEKGTQEDLAYLVQEGMIKALHDQHFQITKKGRLKLAGGGYTGDAMKDKNALMAFRISIIAITIAIISFLVNLFGRIS